MKKRTKVILLCVASLLLSVACNAGFLHRTFQGEFCAHGYKYTVNSDGTVVISHQETYPVITPCYESGPCGVNNEPVTRWVGDMSIPYASLKDMIEDLQKVNKEIEDQSK